MINKFIKKYEDGSWNTVPPVPFDKIKNVNCHKFILYATGSIPWNEMISDPNESEECSDFTYGDRALEISDSAFTLVKDKDNLYSLANKGCETEGLYIGQVLDVDTNEIAHSFLVIKESDESLIYYDKQGFKYPFSSGELGTLLDFVNKEKEKPYQNQKWRFVSNP